MNKATLIIRVQIFVWIQVFTSFRQTPRVILLDHALKIFLVLFETTKLSFQGAAPFCIPTSSE